MADTHKSSPSYPTFAESEAKHSSAHTADDVIGLRQAQLSEQADAKVAPAKPSHSSGRLSVAGVAMTLSACGGDDPSSSSGSSNNTPVATPTPAPTQPAPSSNVSQEEADAARFLLQTSLSASKQEIAQIISDGPSVWLNRMIALPNAESASDFYSRLGYDKVDGNRYFDRNSLTDQMIWSQLLSGENPVRKRWALALSEFFVVSANDLGTRWSSIAMGDYWDLLNRLAFGNFRDLLEAITLCPAMCVFLDTKDNQKADPVTGRQPDENYAREVLQLFSIGLYELDNDGLPKQVAGRPLETYSNADISGLAKCFTGYDFDFNGVDTVAHPNNPAWDVDEPGFASQPMTADGTRWKFPTNQSLHSPEEKQFLDVSIGPGTDPAETLKLALDAISAHPNVGPFFSRQMIQRLVTSNPTPEYVERVAAVFADNGNGVRGDLKAVFRAIVLDDEARSNANLHNYEFGKLREPMLRFVQWGRTFGAASESGTWQIGPLDREYDQLSQSPLRPPSVFGFFRPTFTPHKSETSARSLVAPEFQLVNETSAVGYINFLQDIVEGYGYNARDVKATYTDELEIAADADVLLDHLDLLLCGMQISSPVRSLVRSAIADIPVQNSSETENLLKRIHTAVLLIMASPDYLVQR